MTTPADLTTPGGPVAAVNLAALFVAAARNPSALCSALDELDQAVQALVDWHRRGPR